MVDYQRQLDIFDPTKHSLPVTVVGAGGIGGPTVLALAKLGCKDIRVFDFDEVEEHNQPNQIYGVQDVGATKVYALRSMVARYADCRIRTVNRRLRGSDVLSGVVVGAVDSMASRRLIWERVKNNRNVPLYIDGRLGEQVVRVMSCIPYKRTDALRYEKSLVEDHAVAKMRCTAAGIIDVSFTVASLITRAYRLWATEKEYLPDVFFDQRNLRVLKG